MPQPALNSDLLRSRLKLKRLQSESALRDRHPQAFGLLQSAGLRPGQLRAHATRLLAAGSAAATLYFSPTVPLSTQAALPPASQNRGLTPDQSHPLLSDELSQILPPAVIPLTPVQEEQISSALHSLYGIHASAELEGNRLNRSYGLIGAEQHLPRFPGDIAAAHGSFIKSGITPGRSAWGHFVSSRKDLTPEVINREKYYFAVQTLYLPDWSARLAYLRDWYKHRKMIAINSKNGKAVVGVVADSGPAAWTGKHFGGSPEIMAYLGLNVGKQKGPVIMFFVDDPQDKVPLGPLEYNLENPPRLITT